MKLAFLDASTVNPDDIDLNRLAALGELVLHDITSPGEVIPRCQAAEVVITNKVVLDAATFSACPDLKLVLVAATGVNRIDLDAAARHGVPVCNVAGYSTSSVAQHVATLLLNLSTSIHLLARESDDWPTSPIFTRLHHPITELSGKSFGIVGMGAIGSATAAVVESLGMTVHVLAREGSGNTIRPDLPRLEHHKFFSESDVISLHCPLTPDTENLIGVDTLSLMKTSAFLLNTGRGPLIDESALAYALRHGAIAGAGLDVLSSEPPAADNPLLSPVIRNSGRLIVTPHTAWATREARQRLVDGLAENLQSFLDGALRNRVS